MYTTPDPRPVVSPTDAGLRLGGWRCQSCRHPMLWSSPRCPTCAGTMEADEFGPYGVVWSSTVVRVPVPGRTPPYSMAYVDLTDGPRVLTHVKGPAERLAVGARVTLVEHNADGDVMVEEVA
jgi:uncharacterized OB-fold protein